MIPAGTAITAAITAVIPTGTAATRAAIAEANAEVMVANADVSICLLVGDIIRRFGECRQRKKTQCKNK
jgi:hypothetical protein